MTELDTLLAEAENLWKDSQFAAAIANYDRALEMVGECLRVVHPSGAHEVVPLVQARKEGLVAREEEILIGKAFALLNLPSDFEGKVTRGNEGMEILRQVHRMALAADERWLRAHSTSQCCAVLRYAAVYQVFMPLVATPLGRSRARQASSKFSWIGTASFRLAASVRACFFKPPRCLCRALVSQARLRMPLDILMVDSVHDEVAV
jgi:hypothetical protein